MVPEIGLTVFILRQILPPSDDLCVVSVNPSKDKSADLQMREAAVQLAVFGVPLTNFDPWGIPNAFKLGRGPPRKQCCQQGGNWPHYFAPGVSPIPRVKPR
mgnify:CR=1 FL=1